MGFQISVELKVKYKAHILETISDFCNVNIFHLNLIYF